MIKRPLNSRFNAAILSGRKVTTIRSKPWPVWKDVMLYNWSGLPYRSKQIDLCPVVVESETQIIISNVKGVLSFYPDKVDGTSLFITEGFNSQSDLEEWFSKLVKPGQTITKHLMRFRVIETFAPIQFQKAS